MDQPTGLMAAQLREFIAAWSDVYAFWTERGMWHARRRDNGATVHTTAEDLAEQVMTDWLAKPVRIGRKS
jgi:hypothetical protein